jgi:hypothetical protein
VEALATKGKDGFVNKVAVPLRKHAVPLLSALSLPGSAVFKKVLSDGKRHRVL